MVNELQRNYETIQEKVEPLRKLSGAKTAKMCAEISDAMLKILISSLKHQKKYSRKEIERILWRLRPRVMNLKRSA